MLYVRNLRVGYDQFVLKADFSFEEGSLVSILGPSGAGKTTLINSIAGFLKINSGSIRWKKEDITKLPPGERPVSILFQDYNFFSHLTVEKNVSIGIKPDLRLNSIEREKVFQAIKKVGLNKYTNKKPSELSGGQRTRIALARVIVRSKPLLLLDEAFLGLEPALRLEMLELIMEMAYKENITLLMITHDVKDAIKLNQQIIFVNEGKVNCPIHISKFLNSSDDKIRKYLGR